MPDADHLLTRHRDRLDQALSAIESREFFSAFPESPSPRVNRPVTAEEGKAAFEALLGRRFAEPVCGVEIETYAATESSPFGIELGVEYRVVGTGDVDALLTAAGNALRKPAGGVNWRTLGPARAGVCLEILDRLAVRVFELGNAVQFTTGQPFVMAFQAGGAHALDRALEAIAYAYAEQTRTPAEAVWTKPGKVAQTLAKTFTPVGRGVGLVIGCNTFPTWNSFPGLFSSLACGNAVVVKPHPGAVLPLAITVSVCREVLAEAGFDPNVVQLAAEQPGTGLAKTLAVDPRVKLIDYTGGPEFGEWLERTATGAHVFTEKAGTNAIVLDSTDNPDGMFANLAFTLSLYSGQMCTTTQNIFVARSGVRTPDGLLSPEEVGTRLGAAIDRLLGDDARAVELLGALVSDAVAQRLADAAQAGDAVVATREIQHPGFPSARISSPLVRLIDGGADGQLLARECFGPVSYLAVTDDTAASIALFEATVAAAGAMTAGIYSTDDEVLAEMRATCLEVGVALSENLCDQVYVNQSAAFSDFHGTGANPSANATYTDGAYVANRFRVVQSRRPV